MSQINTRWVLLNSRHHSCLCTSLISQVVVLVAICATGVGCQDATIVRSTEAKSPDGQWLAVANTIRHSGPGNAALETRVFLNHTVHPKSSVEILEFFHDPNGLSDLHLAIKWETPSHLYVTYDGQAASLDFQVVKNAGIEISVSDQSDHSRIVRN